MHVSVFELRTTCLRSLRSLRFRVLRFYVLAALAVSTVAYAQSSTESKNRAWDLSVWAAGATGEEQTNSFSEAQIFSAGIFVGHALTGEIGRGWRRGTFEFGADYTPIFAQFTPRRISGTAFDPVILRWNSSLHRGRIAPFVELGGGGLHTSVNFPQGNTSSFNFMAGTRGGILVSTGRAQALEIACRWWHISNGNLGTQNPEFNGIQVSVGWHWFK